MYNVNYLALVTSGIFSMIWGAIYYGPLLGKQWMKLANIKNKKPKKEEMMKSTAIGFLSYVVLAYVLGYFIDVLGYITWQEGMSVGFWAWLGFIGTSSMGMVLWEGKPWKLYILNNAWSLSTVMVIGAIMAVWV